MEHAAAKHLSVIYGIPPHRVLVRGLKLLEMVECGFVELKRITPEG
jgi:hypothetical protein